MPLIACAECGNQISEQARACPSCGHPVPVPMLKRHYSSGHLVFLILHTVAVFSYPWALLLTIPLHLIFSASLKSR